MEHRNNLRQQKNTDYAAVLNFKVIGLPLQAQEWEMKLHIVTTPAAYGHMSITLKQKTDNNNNEYDMKSS